MSGQQDQYIQHLHSTLAHAAGLGNQATLSQDVKAATVELDNVFKSPTMAVPALAQIALTVEQEQVRQLAAVELRKLVNRVKVKVWAKCPQATRQHIKSQFLERLSSGQEPNKLVQHSIARCVAAIGKIENAKGQWPELLPWLWQSCSSGSVPQREVGMYALFALVDTFVDSGGGASFSQHTPQLFGLLNKAIVDPESLTVQVFAVRIAGKMSDYISPDDENDVRTLQAMIPSIVQVCQAVLAADDEENIKHTFDVLDSLSLSDATFFGNHFQDLVNFLLQAGANNNYSDEARMAPLNALLFLVKYNKSKIQSLQLAKPLLEGLLPIGAQEEPEDHEEDAPARVAFRIIDALANGLPPAQVINPLIQLCQTYSQSPDPGMRKSAIMAFGVTFEGCSIYIVSHIDSLWPFVDQCLADPDTNVRKAACITLGFMCDMIPEDCAKRHGVLLPYIFELVNHDVTRRHALNALDSLLEVLGKDIIPYLPTLMDRLTQLLPNAEIPLRGSIVGAIGSAAHAAKGEFKPYFAPAMALLIPHLALTEEGEQLELRGITQDTVGTLAEAVGKDDFSPYFQQLMQLAFEGTTVESSNMRECSFIFFAVMSRVYKDEFAPFLATIVPLLLASLGQDETAGNAAVAAESSGFASSREVASASASNGLGDDDDDDVFEDLDEEDLEEALMGMNTGVATEKETAADALDELFSNTGTHFLPYLENAVKALKMLLVDYNESLRKSGASALLSFITTANKLTGSAKWSAGLNPEPINSDVKALIDSVIPDIMEMWEDEDDRDVVTSLCDAFSSVVTEVGPSVVAPTHLETICKYLLDLLERKAACQQEEVEEEQQNAAHPSADAELSEWDAHLIRGAEDLVSSLAIAIGPEFAPAFNAFLPALAQYVDPRRQPTERSTAIGALAESINGLKSGSTQFTEPILSLLFASLKDADLDVRSNSAFAVGSLVFQSDIDLSAHYGTILSSLFPLFDRETDSADSNQACDNACGAVARLILKNVEAVPLEQVSPIFLGHLPVRVDFIENVKIFEALTYMLQNGKAPAHTDTILRLMATVLEQQAKAANEDSKPLMADTQEKLVSLLRTLPAEQVQAHGLAAFLQ